MTLNSLQIVNSLLDSYFVQHLATANLTALGAATPVLFLFVSMTFALGTAATALVSRAFGAEDRGGLTLANRKCLGLALIGGLIFALACLPGTQFATTFLLPGGASEAARLMRLYLSVFAFALPALFIVQVLAGSLRGIGDTKSPMIISGIQIGLHITLNAALINSRIVLGPVVLHGLGLGIMGAGLAFTASSWVSAVIYLVWAGHTPLGSCWRFSWPGFVWTKRILNISIPAAMMAVVRVTSLMAFTGVLKQVPQAEAAIGAIRPSFSMESLAFMPAFGLSVAASALVGQSLGMLKPDRAERLAWTAANHAAVVSLAMSVVLFVLAPQVSHFLMPDQPAVATQVTSYLKYICATEVLFGYGMVLVGAFQGAGDTRRPFVMTLACMWGLRVPLAALFALGLSMGASGCWLAMSVTQAVQGVIAMILFKQGSWKTTMV